MATGAITAQNSHVVIGYPIYAVNPPIHIIIIAITTVFIVITKTLYMFDSIRIKRTRRVPGTRGVAGMPRGGFKGSSRFSLYLLGNFLLKALIKVLNSVDDDLLFLVICKVVQFYSTRQ